MFIARSATQPRFLLGNLYDFDPTKNLVPYEQLQNSTVYAAADDRGLDVTESLFFRFFQTVQNFCVVDLSKFYLDVAKDRLYISARMPSADAVVKQC